MSTFEPIVEINGVSVMDMLSAALDEVYRYRKAMAYEARIVEAHYEGLKSFPKSRRAIAEQQVERMRLAVRSPHIAYAHEDWDVMLRTLKNLGDDLTGLTNHSWAEALRQVKASPVVNPQDGAA